QKDQPPFAANSPTETVYAYDGNGNLVSEIQRNQPQDRIHTAVFDALNRPVQRIDSFGNSVTLEDDADGNLTRQVHPLLNNTNYSYDARNRLVQIAVQLMRVTQPPRQVVTSYTYDAVNNRLSEQLPNGNLVQHTYDPVNRLLTTTDSLGALVSYTYDFN